MSEYPITVYLKNSLLKYDMFVDYSAGNPCIIRSRLIHFWSPCNHALWDYSLM